MTEWLDIATTVVPRGLVRTTIPRLLERLDPGPYRLRWVAHLDCPECMADKWAAEADDMRAVARLFASAKLIFAPIPRGCNASFAELFRHVENDMLLIEDDKLALVPVSIPAVMALGDVPYINWGRRATRAGGFECSWWRQDVVRAAVRALPRCPGRRCLERELKTQLKDAYPKQRRRLPQSFRGVFADIGTARLSEIGLVPHKRNGTPWYTQAGEGAPCK